MGKSSLSFLFQLELRIIKRTVVSTEKSISKAYKTLMRPHPEYCIQELNPYSKKDVATWERVQRRATRVIKGPGKFSYEKRLGCRQLTNLEIRRSRGGFTEKFKTYYF